MSTYRRQDIPAAPTPSGPPCEVCGDQLDDDGTCDECWMEEQASADDPEEDDENTAP